MSRPISLVAERAVRYLQRLGEPVDSRALVRELLATTTPDEASAHKLLDTALGGDSRLTYEDGRWTLKAGARPRASGDRPADEDDLDPDRVLLFVHGVRTAPGTPYVLESVSALRLQADEVVAACGGDTAGGPHANRLRRAVLELLDGAVPVTHASRGVLRALDEWLGEPLAPPVSLRRLAHERVGLPASHDLERLVERLGLPWRESEDPLELADTLDACLRALRRPGESLVDLRGDRARGLRPIDWSRYAFNREFLRRVPQVPGTYRFYDKNGRLLYVGKSKNLHRRVGSYFREEGRSRSARVQKLLDGVHRIEYEASGSDLEAVLREAEEIRRDNPDANVQRNILPRKGRGARLRSILILEPTTPPAVLCAYLIRQGRLVDRIPIGPRGGGLTRIERVLADHFFSAPAGPTVVGGPDLDVELVVRWLAAHRDRVVAFDPTDLGAPAEVVDRLRWFLSQGSPFDPDGSPIHTR